MSSRVPDVGSLRARLILCDDHRLVAAALCRLLTPDYVVAAVAYSGSELLGLLAVTPADCLLLDISMPDRNGIDLLPDIRRIQPDLKVLMVTMHVNRYLAVCCLRRGAHGFVPKNADETELTRALSTVLSGRLYVSGLIPKTTDRVGLAAGSPGLAHLTPRQHEIMRLLAEAKRPSAIARSLGISPCTITGHLKIIKGKLGVTSEDQLVQLAVALSLDEPGRCGIHDLGPSPLLDPTSGTTPSPDCVPTGSGPSAGVEPRSGR
jgi:DNA-binding NarL/FixJ family response regulator